MAEIKKIEPVSAYPQEEGCYLRGNEDPPKLAAVIDDEEENLNCYRRVRNEIKAYVETLPESLKGL